MDQFRKNESVEPGVFRPAEDEQDFFARAGSRKVVQSLEPRPIRWPKSRIERRKQFDAWHAVAMQVVHRADISFRTLAVLYRSINWETGTLWPEDATLAEVAGNCSVKTVSRDIQNYKRLGILDVRTVYQSERKRRKRIITLSVPDPMPSEILLPFDDVDHMDTRGPFGRAGEWGDQMDHGGTDHMDTRGPNTFDPPLKGHQS